MGRKPACESATGGHAPGHPASLHEMLHAWENRQPSYNQGRSAKRTTTAGATVILSLISQITCIRLFLPKIFNKFKCANRQIKNTRR